MDIFILYELQIIGCSKLTVSVGDVSNDELLLTNGCAVVNDKNWVQTLRHLNESAAVLFNAVTIRTVKLPSKYTELRGSLTA